MRTMLNNLMPKVAPDLVITSMVLYQNSNIQNTQKLFEYPLEKKRKGLYTAPYGKRVVYFIDDLTMSQKDKYGQSGLLELLRQFFDYNQWYDMQTADVKTIEGISFVSCITCNPSNPRHLLPERNERHWTIIGVPCENNHLRTIFHQEMDCIVQSWP